MTDKTFMNKGSGNKSSYRGLGSIDFQASARSVLIVGRIKDNPQIRVMVQDKSSLAPEGEPIAFELDKENGFRWLGHYDIGNTKELTRNTSLFLTTKSRNERKRSKF